MVAYIWYWLLGTSIMRTLQPPVFPGNQPPGTNLLSGKFLVILICSSEHYIIVSDIGLIQLNSIASIIIKLCKPDDLKTSICHFPQGIALEMPEFPGETCRLL